MYDADAIEAINFEQLATATDRLLLRRGRLPRYRPSLPSLAPLGPLARGSHPRIEQIATVRTPAASHAQVFACSVVIPTLVGLAIGLAALL
jgi:hypothetical protein